MDGSMHGAGTIVVSAEDMNPSTVGSGTTAPVDYVRIRLHSSEFVIPLESQEGLFRPGSSMEFAIDLSFAESMIRKSGGVLDVQSRQDLGTDLILYLPASHLEPREKVSKKITGIKKSDLIGRKKILLMDDEEAILSATSEMLKFLGYEVLTAQNGESAVPLYQSARDTGVPFDAVILDITIPGGLGAKETLAKLVTINPAVKAIISSGYSTNPMILDYRSFGFAAAVVKPYGFKEPGEALDIIFR
jgi:two-component system, cell cycle sensor histidine kinase and response regulator CckA